MPKYNNKLLKVVSQNSTKYKFFNHQDQLRTLHFLTTNENNEFKTDFVRTNFVRKMRQKLVTKIRTN